MNRKLAFVITLTLLIGLLNVTFNVQRAKASGTIYIRSDGSIDPPTAPIQRDGNTYTLTANINDSIVVQRDNIEFDGAGYTIQGQGTDVYSVGIDLSGRNNVKVKNTIVTGFACGIYLSGSSENLLEYNILTKMWDGVVLSYSSNYNTLSGNTLAYNGEGVFLSNSFSNTIWNNNISNNGFGVDLAGGSERNTISNNTISYNGDGIAPIKSSYNIFSGNNITNNDLGIWLYQFSDYSTVSNNNITKNRCGISADGSSNITISGNTVTENLEYGISSGLYSSTISSNVVANNKYGIYLTSPANGRVLGNTIKDNFLYGIYLHYTNDSLISYNDISNNSYGIGLANSYSNLFHHNNFIRNDVQVYSSLSVNTWDDSYTGGGNYWSDYMGKDMNTDGIGDTPYVIDEDNQDNQPFVFPLRSAIGNLVYTYFPHIIFDEEERFYPTDFLYDDVNITNNPSNYNASWPYCVYVHTAETENYLCVQYWFYYCRDAKLWDIEIPFIGAHDHDWESVYVYLKKQNESYSPEFVAYFRHMKFENLQLIDYYTLSSWNDSRTMEIIGTHPIVHVARDSHASYEKTMYGYGLFVTTIGNTPIFVIEPCDEGIELDYHDFQLVYIDESESLPQFFKDMKAPWVRERWNWGDPVFPSPIVRCSVVSLHETGSKLYLHVYDNDSRHVGFNNETSEVEEEIPGSYYEDLGNTTFIILPENVIEFKIVVDATHAHDATEEYRLALTTSRNNGVIDEEVANTTTINKGEQQEFNAQLGPTGEIIQIPELPSLAIIPLFMLASLLAVIVYRRKRIRIS